MEKLKNVLREAWNRRGAAIAQMKGEVEQAQYFTGEARRQKADAECKTETLSRRLNNLSNAVWNIFCASDGTLESFLKDGAFSVRKEYGEDDQPTGRWEVVTARCYLGGCDMDVVPFATQREASLFAAVLTSTGYRPSENRACSECYSEYMEAMEG